MVYVNWGDHFYSICTLHLPIWLGSMFTKITYATCSTESFKNPNKSAIQGSCLKISVVFLNLFFEWSNAEEARGMKSEFGKKTIDFNALRNCCF